jgi:hypothetical protein
MNHSRTARFFVFGVLLSLLTACAPQTTPVIYQIVSAATLQPDSGIPAPKGPVVLKIDGKISQTNSGAALQLDMATLESMGVVQYQVDDPFAKKKILYAGVLISQLLKIVGAAPDATTLTLRALDDYSTDMKISDVKKWPVLLATRADGAYMPIDKNGPLISVFPFNDFPEIDHLTYDAQWLWALAGITVK